MHWKILRSDWVFETPFFQIRRDACSLPNGRLVDDYYVVHGPTIVCIFALTQADEVLWVEQYKHGIGQVCWELPAGFCEGSCTDPLAEAQRELLEETGHRAADWRLLARTINNPTRYDSYTYLYLALGAQQIAEQALDPNEEIIVHRVPLADMPALLRSGKIEVMSSLGSCWVALDALAQLRS